MAVFAPATIISRRQLEASHIGHLAFHIWQPSILVPSGRDLLDTKHTKCLSCFERLVFYISKIYVDTPSIEGYCTAYP